MTIKELREEFGLSRPQFSALTGIPLRTIENWEYGNRETSDWLMPMIELYAKNEYAKWKRGERELVTKKRVKAGNGTK